jgi:hypothetical protein
MKKLLYPALAAAACALAFSIGPARANTTFDVSGTDTVDGFTLGGIIVIDVTNGTIATQPGDVDVTVTGRAGVGPFTGVPTLTHPSHVDPGTITELSFTAGSFTLDLFLPAASLVGYTGGAICGVLNAGTSGLCDQGDISQLSPANGELDSGSLTPVATPLPAALPLFATGLGGLGLLGWRRKRKA